MPVCDLSIELEGENRTFKPGDPIKGTLEVQVDSSCTCRQLTVEAGWKTHGKGNRASGSGPADLLDAGDWEAGRKHRYPFSLNAPSGPISYHGYYLNVERVVRARADIPWALDPKAEEEFVLLAGPAEGYDFGPNHTDPEKAFKSAATYSGCMKGAGVFFLLAGIVCDAISAPLKSVGGLIIGTGLFFIGVLMALFAAWREKGFKALGIGGLEVKPLVAYPGQAIEVELSLAPTEVVKISDPRITLKGQEIVAKGSGTSKTTYRHTLYERTRKLSGPEGEVRAGEKHILRTSLALPPDAAPSFDASDNHLTWTVNIQVGIENYPDWNRTIQLSVLPAGFKNLKSDSGDLVEIDGASQ